MTSSDFALSRKSLVASRGDIEATPSETALITWREDKAVFAGASEEALSPATTVNGGDARP